MIIFFSNKSNGGYGDRLVGITSCIALSILLEHEFQIYWQENLEDVFKDYNPIDKCPKGDYYYKWIDSESLNSSLLRNFESVENNIWKNKTIIIETNQPIHYNLFYISKFKTNKTYSDVTKEAYSLIYSKYLVLKDNIKEKIINTNNSIGLQIRCGDYYLTGNKDNHYLAPDNQEKLITMLTENIDNKSKIFLTTDNEKIIEPLSKIFENIILYKNKIAHFDKTNDVSSIINVILEHISLSQCNSIITSLNSNFGITASLIGKVNKILLYQKNRENIFYLKEYNHQKIPFLKSQVPDKVLDIFIENNFLRFIDSWYTFNPY
jgi:hypothetical protein